MKKLCLIPLLAILIGCNGSPENQTAQISPATILDELQLPGLNRVSAIQTYVGDSLYEYIDGGAELYHQYNFKDVATGELKYNNIELNADIYRFDNPIDAFGLYSMQRPPVTRADSSGAKYGIESYISETSIDFVKGAYVVKLLGYEPLPETRSVLYLLADELDRLIPGTTQKPETYSLFPKAYAVEFSEKYYAVNFLGHSFLSEVYTQDYQIDGDTLTLFFAADDSGEKFAQWANQVTLTEDGMKFLKDLPYKPGKAFLLDDNYYGQIVAGSVDARLAGILNFRESQKPFLADWLKTLNAGPVTHK